jgi:hypothetical protein
VNQFTIKPLRWVVLISAAFCFGASMFLCQIYPDLNLRCTLAMRGHLLYELRDPGPHPPVSGLFVRYVVYANKIPIGIVTPYGDFLNLREANDPANLPVLPYYNIIQVFVGAACWIFTAVLIISWLLRALLNSFAVRADHRRKGRQC